LRWRDVKQNRISNQKPKSEEKSSLPFVSHPDKIKAFITDSFLLAMPIFYVVIYLIMGDLKSFHNEMLRGWIYIIVPLGIINILFYSLVGQTPGMKAYNIKIIDIKTKEKPSFILAFLRFFFFNIILLSIVGLFMSLFRKDNRGLYEQLSGTALILTEKGQNDKKVL